MSKIVLGETRREAINRVQEMLGPVVSRPLAESTFWALAKKGKISMDPANGSYLIESDVDDAGVMDAAKAVLDQQSQGNARRTRGVRPFTLNHNSMHQARVSTAWSAKSAYNSMKTAFAPSLSAAESYQPDQNLAIDVTPSASPSTDDNDQT